MEIVEETDEYRFVQRAVELLKAENLRPDREPGGCWRFNFASGAEKKSDKRILAAGCDLQLTWGLHTDTEFPAIRLFNDPALLNGPYGTLICLDFPARLALWRTAWRNRKSNPVLANLDFRKVVLISAILGSSEDDDETDQPS